MKLYTIAKMAKTLKIPESTVRFYRDRHSEFLPYQGTGRKKRYKEEALKALRTIAELAKRNLTAEEIEEQLSQEYSRNVEAGNETTGIIAVEQQESIARALTDNLKAIADQKQEIQELREEVKEISNLVKLSWWERMKKKGSSNNG